MFGPGFGAVRPDRCVPVRRKYCLDVVGDHPLPPRPPDSAGRDSGRLGWPGESRRVRGGTAEVRTRLPSAPRSRRDRRRADDRGHAPAGAMPAPLGEEGPSPAPWRRLLDRPGIDVHLQAVVPGRPNVIATVRGGAMGPALLLNAHLDAAWAPGSHGATRTRRDRGRPALRGRDHRHEGAAGRDDRGPARPPRRLRLAAGGDLVLHAVMAHNPTGLGTKYALATEPSRAGQAFAIVGQGSSLELQTENGGRGQVRDRASRGVPRTSRSRKTASTRSPRRGASPTRSRARASRSRSQPSDRLPGFPKFVVGELIAGGRAGVPALLPGSGSPDQAVLRGDVRTVPGMDRHTVTADLEAVVAAAAPDVVASRVRIISDVHPFVGRPRVAADRRALGCPRGRSRRAARARDQRSSSAGSSPTRPIYEEHGIPSVGLRPGPVALRARRVHRARRAARRRPHLPRDRPAAGGGARAGG